MNTLKNKTNTSKASTLRKQTKTEDKKVTSEQDAGIHLTQILNYYRGRVEAFEKDRTQWYSKLEQIRVRHDLVHKVEWELKKRQEEKSELERAMQQCQTALYNEREKIIKMKEGGDMLKIKGKENRQLILELLEANNSVEQHVFYQKDEAPEKIQSYSKKTMGKPMTQTVTNLRKTIEEHKKNPTIHYDYKSPNILRTIHLPNENVGQVKNEVDVLHQQIQEQRVYYENILAKLRDEKGQFEEEQRSKYIDYVEEIENLSKKLSEQEVFNYQVVKDHVDLMAQYELEERQLQEEVESMRIENAQIRDQIRDTSKQTELQKKEAKNEYVKSTQEYQERFREQTKIQKENMAIIKDQYKKVQEIYKRKMSEMTDRLEKETKKMQVAEQRRKLDLEGYGADLLSMKKKIAFYQKYIMKLKNLVDEDQGEILNGMDSFEQEEQQN